VSRNFTKFLVDKEGTLVARYGMFTTPEALKAEIEKLL
jgi:glutathione peroxidase